MCSVQSWVLTSIWRQGKRGCVFCRNRNQTSALWTKRDRIRMVLTKSLPNNSCVLLQQKIWTESAKFKKSNYLHRNFWSFCLVVELVLIALKRLWFICSIRIRECCLSSSVGMLLGDYHNASYNMHRFFETFSFFPNFFGFPLVDHPLRWVELKKSITHANTIEVSIRICLNTLSFKVYGSFASPSATNT